MRARARVDAHAFGIVVLLLVGLLLVEPDPAFGKNTPLHFSGTMSGQFMLGGSNLPPGQFYIFETAAGGIDVGSPLSERLGDSSFSYAAVFLYDQGVLPDPLPEGCVPAPSSSSEFGRATMFFGEGELRLELVSGFSCFFLDPGPKVEVSAIFEIVDGTGLFKNARGSLQVTVDGTIGPFDLTAEFEGEVRLKK